MVRYSRLWWRCDCSGSLPRRERMLRLQRACSVAPPRDHDVVLFFSIRHLAVLLHRSKFFAPHGEDHGDVARLSLLYIIQRCLVRKQVARRLEMHLPGALLPDRGEPMLETAVRVTAEHDADDALIRRDLLNRVK